MLRRLFLGLLIGVNAWLLAGCVVPYLEGTVPDYLILLPSFVNLAFWCAVGIVTVLLVRAVHPGEHLSPLLLLVLPLVSVAMLATPLRAYAAPWLYVGIDLRPWLFLAIAILLAFPVRRASARLAGRWLEISLVAVLATASLLSSPTARFQSVLIGDEPKYLRYLENWYRGRGMDVAELGPSTDLPPDFRPDLVGNVRHLGGGARQIASDLMSDVRRRLGLAAPPPLHATSQGGWFVDGKRGGVYQVHNPGLSFLLMPGYVVDRTVGRTFAWNPQFPTDLYATNVTVLVLYLLWGVALFRLLRTYTGDATLSWLITIVLFLSLPVSAFAYQYYPEVAAGLLLTMLMTFAVLSTESRLLRVGAYGFAAGFLPWLHPRFLPLTLGAAVAVAITRRRERRAIGVFLTGLGIPLILMGAYYYYVTGSAMPWALYSLMPDAALFSASRAWRDLPAFWFDRSWGLVAHAPVYLFALPGLWLVWRKNRAVALAILYAVLAIAIPAAGHGYTGAFTTPLRLVAAVVPLLALPLAEATMAFAGITWFRLAMILAAVISVQTGFTYNAHLVKSEAFLHGATIGGWMFPLLLPDFDAARLAQPMTMVWLAVTVGLLAYPVLQLRSPNRVSSERGWSLTATAATVIVVFVIASSAVGALTGLRFKPAFMLYAGDARDRAIRFELNERPGFRWSSQRGAIDLASYFPNPEGTAATLTLQPEAPTVQQPVEFSIDARRPGNRPAWGTATVDFGDGSPVERVPIEGTTRRAHAYSSAGDYRVSVDVALWGLPRRQITRVVRVAQD